MKEIIDKIKENFVDIQAIYIFGSYDTEYFNDDSDIDIAILLPIKNYRSSEIKENISRTTIDLMRLTGRDIDLVNLRELDTVFKNEIINNGQLVYCNDDLKRNEFEMYTISDYQKLNQERKEIIEDIKNTGKVLKG